jgi:Tryptophan halogenase
MLAGAQCSYKYSMKYDITIVGGGTAGWLSAAFLSFHNPEKTIALIESPDIPTIGVGEGTFPTTMHVLNSIGIPPQELIVKANGGLKMAIQYVDFAQKPFWLSVENETDWERFGSELVGNLSLMNKSPIVDHASYLAMHFVASDLAELLKSHALKRNVTHISAKVIDSIVVNNYCKNITLEDKSIIESNWFLDCSGFARALIKQTSSQFTGYAKELLVDSAVVGPTPYKNPEKEFNPFTQITAKSAGWQFRIPTYTRIGNGYVYSSQFISDAEAEKELGIPVKNQLRMNLGYYNELLVGNIVAVGLSGGFIEPMEATAIHLSERTLIVFDEMLKNKRTIDSANEFLRNKIRYIKTLILAHYAFSERTDPFWKAAKNAARNSTEIVEFLDKLKNKQFPTKEDQLDVAYPYCQWNDLLRGFNQPHYYPSINTQAKKDIYVATYHLPNHYQYITRLRNQK